MAISTAYPLPTNLSPTVVTNTTSLIRIVALALISAAAIASRLFAVINFESIIHELCVRHSPRVKYRVDVAIFTATHGSISEWTCIQ
jgi:hypothetical protein